MQLCSIIVVHQAWEKKMKQLIFKLLMISALISQSAIAMTPTETLEITVNQLIGVVSSSDKTNEVQKAEVDSIIKANVDFDAVSKKVVSKPWKKATEEQKQAFKTRFANIMVNTYFDLLKNYNNEEVIYGKEQIKKNKYAIVDTKVISEGKKIPVRYRLIKVEQNWKIYDFIVEGVSIVSSYRTSYKPIIKQKGLQGLLEEMNKTVNAAPQ